MRNEPIFIAITGGPCSGKSTFLSQAYEQLQTHNFHVMVLSESSTELITANAGPPALGLYAFESHLVLYQLTREGAYLKMASELASRGKKVVILCDRGVPDCQAYMTPEHYLETIGKQLYTPMDMLLRYKMAIHLVTAANGAEEFYTCENNPARTESPEEARQKDTATLAAWAAHPHRFIIDNSTSSIGAKIHRAKCALARVLDMPEPKEIERKFKVLNFSPLLIPEDAIVAAIAQTYLHRADGKERRVRARECLGSIIYTYTEKLPTKHRGERIEYESIIPEKEYLRLLSERDSSRTTLTKHRYLFSHAGHQFELDVFKSGRPAREGLVLLEVELGSMDEPVEFPPEWQLKEVTGDPVYSNYELARP